MTGRGAGSVRWGRTRLVAITLVVTATAAGVVPAPAPVAAAPSALPATIDCSSPDEVIVLTEDALLDPACTYTGGIEIVAPGVTLDCAGARISNDGPPGLRWGVLVHSPVDVPLHDVTVRNCVVEGFLNDIKITRDGFRDLPEGAEYEHAYSDILIEDNIIRDSVGVGIFVDGYVTGVTISDNLITGTGSSGIYLETGSVGTEVVGNRIVDNGYRENGPEGQSFELGATSFWFWGVGREGVAVDGSRGNRIADNHFEGNSVGGVLLYKNCGEFPGADRYFERRYGSHDNVIEGNRFVGGTNGVWVGSRMAENTLPMECTDPAYVDEPLRRVVLDRASGNTIRANRFDGVTYGIRVEDDDTRVEDNHFTGDVDDHAVIVGTPVRTEVLGRPVDGTVLVGNMSAIGDNPTPYRWIHGHVRTVQSANTALGREVVLCEGAPVPRSSLIFVVGATVWDPSTPPPARPEGLELPLLGPLEPCDQPDRRVPGFGLGHPRTAFEPGAEDEIAGRLAREPYRSIFLEAHARNEGRAARWAPGDPGRDAQKDMARAARWLAFEYALDRTVVDGAIVPFPTAEARQAAGDQVRELLLGAYERSRFAVPPPLGGWDRDIDTAGELLMWSGAFDLLLGAGYAFEGDDTEIAGRLTELAAELYRNYARPETASNVSELHQNNHRSKSGASLAIAAAVLAEYALEVDDPDGSRDPLVWWDRGVTQVDEILRHVLVAGDGAYAEGPHYLRFTTETMAPYSAMWERVLGDGSWTTGEGRTIPALHHGELFARSHDWMVAMTLPDGTLAPVDDSNTQEAHYFGALPAGLPNSDVYAWRWATGRLPYTTDGSVDLALDSIVAYDDSVTPQPPDGSPTSFWPEGGNAFLRSGWGPLDTLAIVQAEGPTASEFGRDAAGVGRGPQSHEHMEPGSFLLHALGTTLALDPGYLSFGDHDRVLGAEDHNTVLVDGVGPSPMLRNTIAWRNDPLGPPPQDGFATLHSTLDTDRLDRAVVTTRYGSMAGAPVDIELRREFLFVDDRYLVIIDDVVPDGDDTVRLDWLLHGNGGGTSGGSYTPTDGGGVWTRPEAGLARGIATTAGAPQISSRLEEHESPDERRLELTHVAEYATVQTDGPVRAVQVVVPFPTSSGPPAIDTRTEGGEVVVTVDDPVTGRQTTIRTDDGETVVVDRDATGGDVVAYASGDHLAPDERTFSAPGADGVVLADGDDGAVELAADGPAHSLFLHGDHPGPTVVDGACGTSRAGRSIRVDPSASDRVVLRRGRHDAVPGVVVAGPARRRVPVGDTVTLEASESCDDDRLAGVQWELVSAPRGSAWRVRGADTWTSELDVDATGTFRVRATVTDAAGNVSDPVEVEIIGGDRCADERDDDLDGRFDAADPDCDGPEPPAPVDSLGFVTAEGEASSIDAGLDQLTVERRLDGSPTWVHGQLEDGDRTFALDVRVRGDRASVGRIVRDDPAAGERIDRVWRGRVLEPLPGVLVGIDDRAELHWIAVDRSRTG